MSESEENTPCKRLKTSDESMRESICTVSEKEEKLMGKIRLGIREQMDLNTDLFNEKLEGLNRRVDQIECGKTHGEIVKILLEKVSKLEKCIDPVIASQKEAVTKAADTQSEMKEEKSEVSHIKEEENHDNGEDSQAIVTSSSKNPHLAKDLFCAELAEESDDPSCNHETERGFCVKSEEDCTPLDLSRK